jgi:hypothetical protein
MSNELNEVINGAKSQARSEKIRKFFDENAKILKIFGVALGAFAVASLVFAIVYNSREAKFSAVLHQSLVYQQLNDIAKAEESLKQIYDAKLVPGGVRSLAMIRYAAFLLDKSDYEGAVKVYQELNQCRSCDQYVRELSGLLIAKIWSSNQTEIEKEDVAQKIEKIEGNSKILRFQIAEQRALLELQKNNFKKSYQIFEMIEKNSESSPELKIRARDGMRMIVSKGFDPLKS